MKIKKYHQVDLRRITFVPLLTGLFLTLVLGGCANTDSTRIEAKDVTLATPEMRMAINLDHENEAALLHTGHAIELGVTSGRGGATQSLESGQSPILIGETVMTPTTFTGPQQLRNDFAFTYSEILWRYRKFFKEGKYGIEWSAGLGESTIDLKVASATQVATDRFKESGIRGGVGLIYSLNDSSSFQLRGLLFKSAESSMGRAELVYAKKMLKNFRLRAGFAGGNILGYRHLRSDYSFKFVGPILALDMEF